jgi:hypothetical protein
MRTAVAGVVIACELASVRPAAGARPLVTDDARLVDPGACQLETWTRLGDAGDEYWAVPACTLITNLELTAGVAVLPAEPGGKPEHPSVQLQAKTALASVADRRVRVALVAGTVVRAHGAVAALNADRVGEFYGYVPATFTVVPDRAWVHLNLGVRYRGDGAGAFALWGAALETVVLGPVTAIAEAYGDAPDPAFMQGGIRLTVVPDRLQIDATYGRRIPDGADDEWATVGLRILTPQLFEPFDLGAAVRRVVGWP